MVVSNYPNWPRIFTQIGKLLVTCLVLSLVALILDWRGHVLRYITVPETIVSVLGAALGILLAFRTNSAYARWWEARTLWGAMVNQSRSLARQVVSFPRPDAPESATFSRTILYRQIAFVNATRCALRKQAILPEIAPWLDEPTVRYLSQMQNVPDALLGLMGRQLREALDQRLIDQWQQQRIDQTLSELSNVLGACERIKNTPLPRQYDYYPELFIKAYCFILPFIIVDDVGLATPAVTVLTAFAFLVLNRIGKNLEDPFENQPYDIPITALCRTIEINIRQGLGESDVPQPLALQNGVLM